MTFMARHRRIALGSLVVALALVAAACIPAVAPSASPGASGPLASPAATPTPAAAIPLQPAVPGANPVDLLAWLFTPIFWVLFNALVVLERATGSIAIAIVLVTIAMRALVIPLYRHQLVSQRRIQLVQPELRELQRRYKGDRQKALEAQQRFYKERGINPASGCLPALLQMGLLIPMYSVFAQGLQNFNPQAMSLLPLNCPATPVIDQLSQHVAPCINPIGFGVDWSKPETLFSLAGFGISMLGVVAGLLGFLQSKMTLPRQSDAKQDDPNTRIQRQMAFTFPLIYILLGGTWPAGLLLYIIVTEIFAIAQQYLILGWGGTFPLFGWDPAFARDHTPRFPVAVPAPNPNAPPSSPTASRATTSADRAAKAAATVRPRERGRQGRRGRRR